MSLTRAQLFQALSILKEEIDLEKITKRAMNDYEEHHWRENLESAPHGQEWHTSFHASSFPGEEKACDRKLLYTMMNIPSVGPIPAKLRGQAEMGKAVEEFIISKWKFAGILLGEQVKFEDKELWLTGSADAILDVRPDYNAVLPVDIKSKDHEVIEQMRIGLRSYDEKHYYQLQAYIYLCATYHYKFGWDKLGLKPARGGKIYYASRQDPTYVKEFYIKEDMEFAGRGVQNLIDLRLNYEKDILPERPKDWKWTEEPCKWCPFKRDACKPDWKENIDKLSNSNGIEFAKGIREDYDYDKTREEVLKRWN